PQGCSCQSVADFFGGICFWVKDGNASFALPSRGAASVNSQGRKPLGGSGKLPRRPGGPKVACQRGRFRPARGFQRVPFFPRGSRPWLLTDAAPRLGTAVATIPD